MSDPQPSDVGTYEVAAKVPGRLRIRIRLRHGGGGGLAHVAESLCAAEGVHAVRTTRTACSVVVTHAHDTSGIEGYLGILDDLGYKRREPAPANLGIGARASAALPPAFRPRDPAVAGPMVLGILSARQLVRYGPQLHKAPWYTFAWYAYSVYASRRRTEDLHGDGTTT